MVAAVIASAMTWIYITPLYFVSGGKYAETGGLDGAIEVLNIFPQPLKTSQLPKKTSAIL
jgi:hypothetical protein